MESTNDILGELFSSMLKDTYGDFDQSIKTIGPFAKEELKPESVYLARVDQEINFFFIILPDQFNKEFFDFFKTNSIKHDHQNFVFINDITSIEIFLYQQQKTIWDKKQSFERITFKQSIDWKELWFRFTKSFSQDLKNLTQEEFITYLIDGNPRSLNIKIQPPRRLPPKRITTSDVFAILTNYTKQKY